ALGISHIEAVDLINIGTILGLCLKIDLPLTTKAVELVHVGAAQEGLKRLVDFAELETLLQHAILIDVHEELGHRRAESGDQRRDLRPFPRGLIQLFERFRKLLNRSTAAILQHERKAASRAEARNRRRAEGKRDGFRDLFA